MLYGYCYNIFNSSGSGTTAPTIIYWETDTQNWESGTDNWEDN